MRNKIITIIIVLLRNLAKYNNQLHPQIYNRKNSLIKIHNNHQHNCHPDKNHLNNKLLQINSINCKYYNKYNNHNNNNNNLHNN